MSGWLVSLVYEANAGIPTIEALFASWHEDSADAADEVARFDPVGSRVVPRPVVPLSESILRGLNLQPGETGRLRASPRPFF